MLVLWFRFFNVGKQLDQQFQNKSQKSAGTWRKHPFFISQANNECLRWCQTHWCPGHPLRNARVDSLESFWVNENMQAIDWRSKPDCSFVWETDINFLCPRRPVNGLVLQKRCKCVAENRTLVQRRGRGIWERKWCLIISKQNIFWSRLNSTTVNEFLALAQNFLQRARTNIVRWLVPSDS